MKKYEKLERQTNLWHLVSSLPVCLSFVLTLTNIHTFTLSLSLTHTLTPSLSLTPTHSPQALGTVTGIINGSGSVTAALGQLAIPILYQMGINDKVGYRYVWYFLIFCTAVGTSLLSPRIYKELYPRPTAPLAPIRGHYSAISGAEKA